MRWLLALMLLGCAHRGAGGQPSEAELRGFYYRDDEGLEVVTVGAQLTQRLPWGDAISLTVDVDAIDLQPVDAVSSASVGAGGEDGDPGLVEQRYEISPAYVVALGSDARPLDLSVRARVSTEPDYFSWSGELGANVELCQRNTALAGFVGYGRDTIDPDSFAEDDEELWPDSHQRVYGGISWRQLLDKRVDLTSGISLSWQSGALGSPYRRSQVVFGQGFLVRVRALGERHPGERTRAVGHLGSSIYLGLGLALHLRLIGYLDSWDVMALAPEVGLNIELGRRGLLLLDYRYTVQGAADFYRRRYTPTDDTRTGDRRLGALDEHFTGLELRWTLIGTPQAASSLDAAAGWSLSLLTYRDLNPDRSVTAHLGTLGLLWRY